MAQLVRMPVADIPVERHYQPLSRGRFYARSIPMALAVGMVASGLVVTAPMPPTTTVLGIWSLVVWRVLRQRRRTRRMVRSNDEAQALLAAGALDEAGQEFEALCRQGRDTPALHSLFVYNRATTYLRAGEVKRARELFRAVLEAGWLSHGGSVFFPYLPLVHAGIGTSEALLGDLEAAEHWRSEAHATISSAKRGLLLPLDLLIDARKGQHEQVLQVSHEAWPHAENLLTASQLRLVRLLQAFALEQVSGAAVYRHMSHGEQLQDLIRMGRPARTAELAHVTSHWPAFADFLSRHGLGRAESAPSM